MAFKFANAEKTEKKSSPKNNKKRVEIELVHRLATLRAMRATITAMENAISQTMKEGPMTDHFVKEGLLSKTQPENFEAFLGEHTASAELRKRSSASPLKDDVEIALCRELDLPLRTEVVVPNTYILNPDYMPGGEKFDPKILAAVEKALGAKGVPDDIMLEQEGETKIVTTDETLPSLFKLGENAIRRGIGVVGVMAVKPKYHIENNDLTPLFKDFAEIMQDGAFKNIIVSAATNPDSVLKTPSVYSPKKVKKTKVHDLKTAA